MGLLFKKGDVVEFNCVGCQHSRYTHGKHYTVLRDVEICEDDDDDDVLVWVKDDKGYADNSWLAYRFKLVKSVDDAVTESTSSRLDFTKPITTRDGRPVTIVVADWRGSKPVLAYIGDEQTIRYYTLEGNFFIDGRVAYDDLINVKSSIKPSPFYVNVYPDGRLGFSEDRETAELYSASTRIACIRVELDDVEEGRFDE